MKHDPQDPVVAEAYQNLIEQTTAQYNALIADGYEFYFIDLNTAEGQEYASSPFNAMFELRNDKRMGVFATDEGFGSDQAFDPANNPMLADTGFQWAMGPAGATQTVYANDLFRAVHDAFGHGLEFAGFRARGEENAWQAHVRLFTGSAVAAITTETRGQNSWLNYGPHGENNRTAKVEDTIFADQKTGLMPEFTWSEGKAGPRTFDQSATPRENTITVAETGEPLQLYHGTTQEFDEFGSGKIFLSSRRGLAVDHAMRAPESAGRQPRVIEATVAFDSPLIVGPVDTDPDVYWMQNTLSLESQLKDHDGLLIYNDDGEVMAIAKKSDQVTQQQRQFDQSPTATPAFQKWFGDSKVVDENGDPLVVYHGTPREGFEAFDPKTFGTERDAGFYGQGAYFAVSEGVAESYAETEDGGEGTVLATYLSVENPYIIDLSMDGWPETRQSLIDLGIRSASRSDPERGFTYTLQNREPAEFSAMLEEMGYDGVFCGQRRHVRSS
jgi:hypothetical protein